MKNLKFKITEKITLTHFFLMFGYKLFSLYFPLYLLERSFSIIEVGYTSFLIYISIAIFAPIAGYLNYRIKPHILIALGVIGYGVYSGAMPLGVSIPWFYLFQILLGISGALFFVSSRSLLMVSDSKKINNTFAWFYSAPTYADAIAPALGALIIWKFGFFWVFFVALIIQLLTSIYAYIKLKEKGRTTSSINIEKSIENYREIGQSMEIKSSFFIFLSFLILFIIGFYNIFFVLFLKSLNWTQEQILIFNSLTSLFFLPISILIAKKAIKSNSKYDISFGGQIIGICAVLLGIISNALNYISIFILIIVGNIGSLIASSGRSGLMAIKLKKNPNESAAIDTIFSPLSTAIGALLGGFLIQSFGYSFLFILFGIVIFVLSIIGSKVMLFDKK
ncbi:MAG: MFS transporter [Candidatus Paceibacterota bacterium]